MNFTFIFEIAMGVFLGGYILLIIARKEAVKFEVRAYWRSLPESQKIAFSSELLELRGWVYERRKSHGFEIFLPDYKPKYIESFDMDKFYHFFSKRGRFYGE